VKAPAPYKKNNTVKGGMQVEKEISELVWNLLKLIAKVIILVGAVIGVTLAVKGVL